MGSMSLVHWLIVLAVVVLVFGTRKLPNIGRDLGGAIRGFKDGMKEGAAEPTSAAQPPAAPPQQVSDARSSAPIDVAAREKSGH